MSNESLTITGTLTVGDIQPEWIGITCGPVTLEHNHKTKECRVVVADGWTMDDAAKEFIGALVRAFPGWGPTAPPEQKRGTQR